MSLIELCAVCDDGLVNTSRVYPVIENKLYAVEQSTRFQAQNLLHLIPNDGKYRARIVSCYVDAPPPSKVKKVPEYNPTAYLRIEGLFADGFRRTDRSERVYHSKLGLKANLGFYPLEPEDFALPINSNFMSGQLSQQIDIHIDTVHYIRSGAAPPPQTAKYLNAFRRYRKPIVLQLGIELIKDDTVH